MTHTVISCFSQSWTMQSRQDVYTFAKHVAWSSICSYIYMYRNITRTYKSSDSRSRAPINTCTQTPAGLVFSNEIFIGVSLEGIMQSGQHRCHTHGHTNHHSLNSHWKSYNIQDMLYSTSVVSDVIFLVSAEDYKSTIDFELLLGTS